MAEEITDSRTRRFVGGLGIGYLHTAIVTIVGLWLTPFLLRHLDQHDYGLWLLTAQMLFYLGLTDAGIVALLPREIAFATGRASGTRTADLQRLVGETTRLVLWQLPIVVAIGVVMWWLVARTWAGVGGAFAIVGLTFVTTFPLRIVVAALQGLQDLTFLGGVQLVAWIAGTVLTVALVEAGFGIYAVATGWACTQVLGVGLAWWRLHRRFPDVVPRQLPALSMTAVRAQMSRGVWVSLAQIAQVLINGTDLMVIGTIMGPAAVVPYAVTAKLVTLLANQPQLFMQTALPALSELRTSVSRPRMFQISTSMSQIMLLGSGAIACVVLAVNSSFVSWWVGPDRFAGAGVTALLVLGMLLRHWNVSAVYTLFCFGNERRLAITTAADGLAGVVAMLALVPWLGYHGAALGTMLGTIAVSLPFNLTALAREEGVPLLAAVRPLRPWSIRFALAASAVVLAATWWPVHGWLNTALLGGAVSIAYGALMLPVLARPPLGSMLVPRLGPWLAFIPGFSKRLASEPASIVQS